MSCFINVIVRLLILLIYLLSCLLISKSKMLGIIDDCKLIAIEIFLIELVFPILLMP
jgi:hypothetical protein